MSPEQAEGKPLDARSDIFSFGAVLYEMVTGQRAFRGDSKMSTLSAVLHKEPAALPAEAPHDLSRIITRCLRKAPERRFQTTADLKVALEELKEESDSGALPEATGIPPGRFRRRRALLAAVLLTATALAVVGWHFLRPRMKADATLKVTPLTSYAGVESAPCFSPDGNEIAFVRLDEKGEHSDIYRQVIGPGKPLRLTTDPATDFAPAWSPDGRTIAFLRALGRSRAAVVLIPALGGQERVLGETTIRYRVLAPPRGLDWSPDGQWLAVCGTSLSLLSVQTGEKRRLTSPPEGQLDQDPAFSPDGRSLAFVRVVSEFPEQLFRLDLGPDLAADGSPERLPAEGEVIQHPVWTADSREILYTAGSITNKALWRIASGGRTPARQVFPEGSFPALSRRADRLAFVRSNLNTDIWRVQLPGPGRRTAPPAKLISSTHYDAFPQYSPDGKRIVFESRRSGSAGLWIADDDGGNAWELISCGAPHCGYPSWSPDGRQVAFHLFAESPDIYTVDAGGGQPRRLTTHPAADLLPTWSRDGRWIYFSSTRTGRYEIWKLPPAGGDAVQVTRQGGFYGWESPDGNWLYFVKDRTSPTSLCKVPTAGGEESRLIDGMSWVGFAVTRDGVYWAPSHPVLTIHFLPFATGESIPITSVGRRVWPGLAISPDNRYLLYTAIEESEADLMLVENFR